VLGAVADVEDRWRSNVSMRNNADLVADRRIVSDGRFVVRQTASTGECAMRLQTRLLMFRATLLLRRANRRRRRHLAADLATYTNDADLNDLYALLETYPDGQTSELREILGRQRIRRSWAAGRAICAGFAPHSSL
jgi:hypothetical protein